MTGGQDDLVVRLFRWLPQGWFPSEPGTRIYALVSGFAAVLSYLYALLAYVQLQTRVATTTDGFLDLASQDFLGAILPRIKGEPDKLFQARIRREVLRERVTRHAIDSLLFDMTGAHPTITELQRPADIGCYGSTFYMGHSLYGSRDDAFSVFIQTEHAGSFSIPSIAGWGTYLAGLGSPQLIAATDDMKTGTGFTDADIYSAMERIRAAGVTYWVHIGDGVETIFLAGETGQLIEAAPGEFIII